MDFKNEDAKSLFLRYALPCGYTLVKRGIVTKSFLKETIRNIAEGKKVRGRPEKIFSTAILMCNRIAKKSGKRLIDKSTVRRYFLFEHDKIVSKRYNIFKDFNSMKCRTYSGKVLEVKNNKALVRTVVGKSKYKSDFYKGLKKGDYVVVHRDFIVERINEKMFKQLWSLKERYFKSGKSIMIA